MTKKQPILLTEAHHGGILVSFYKAIMDLCGRDRGYDLFMTASRAYGERRGRRMALRAVRDGNPLDVTSYFAYGELLCTDKGLMDESSYEACGGTVHVREIACGPESSEPWTASSVGSIIVRKLTALWSGASTRQWALSVCRTCI